MTESSNRDTAATPIGRKRSFTDGEGWSNYRRSIAALSVGQPTAASTRRPRTRIITDPKLTPASNWVDAGEHLAEIYWLETELQIARLESASALQRYEENLARTENQSALIASLRASLDAANNRIADLERKARLEVSSWDELGASTAFADLRDELFADMAR